MSKKMKLSLDQLKVQSFVTTLSGAKKRAVKGGDSAYECTEFLCSEPCTMTYTMDVLETCDGDTMIPNCSGTCAPCSVDCTVNQTCVVCVEYP